eukprot:TRINITY_DN9653_c0_g1_i1.p1 TRINITY_DN9653_c0_g1~~TRINITY_DN9653_c0_g1_i1.p1  ORF type:complete len:191 (-),score=9.37 TRINITY_DN9653_c0_g1_i1:169-741(-)
MCIRDRSETVNVPSKSDSEGEFAGIYDCHICLDVALDPVVTQCGHLFCWPCLYQWLQHTTPPVCPVCKAGVSEDKLVPIFVGSASSGVRRRAVPGIPARPRGQPEPVRRAPEGFEDAEAEAPPMRPPFSAHAQSEQLRSTLSVALFPSILGHLLKLLRSGSLCQNAEVPCTWRAKGASVVCLILILLMVF